jgi:4-amino-4-deoxy-L-arabinose transferase-like glycosyltransferase
LVNQPQGGASSPALSERAAVFIAAAAALVRLGFAPAFDLFPQEVYYFLYAQHPSLSYFDHPPVLAYCLRAARLLLGHHAITLRLCAFALTLGTQLGLIALVRRIVPVPTRGRALAILLTSGLFTVLSLISTPDVPLLLFWVLTLLALHRAIFDSDPLAFLLAGVCAGLAFDSKYPGIFLQLGLVLFLFLTPRGHRLLRTPWPYLCIGVAQTLALPVYLWNARNAFASFRFQTADRLAGSQGPTLHYLLVLVGTQLVLVGPALFIALGRELVGAAKRLKAERPSEREQTLFLLAFVVPLLAVCLAASLFVQVKPNWLMPCYLAGTLLLAPRISRALVFWTLGTSLLLHGSAVDEILLYPVPIRNDDTFYGWSELAAAVAERERTLPGDFVFSADSYKTPAELSFYLREKVYAGNILGLPALQFDYLGDDLESLRGKNALFIESAPSDFTAARAEKPPERLLAHFGSVQELDPILIRIGQRIVRKFFVYQCHDYLGPHFPKTG